MGTKNLPKMELGFKDGDFDGGFNELELVSIRPVENGFVVKISYSDKDTELVYMNGDSTKMLADIVKTFGLSGIRVSELKEV